MGAQDTKDNVKSRLAVTIVLLLGAVYSAVAAFEPSASGRGYSTGAHVSPPLVTLAAGLASLATAVWRGYLSLPRRRPPIHANPAPRVSEPTRSVEVARSQVLAESRGQITAAPVVQRATAGPDGGIGEPATLLEGTVSTVPNLKKVRSDIKVAWILILVSASLTFILSVLAIQGTSLAGITPANLIDVALLAGLSFGVYKRNRPSALLAVFYYVFNVASKLITTASSASYASTPAIAVSGYFAWYVFKGAEAVFAFHRSSRNPALQDDGG